MARCLGETERESAEKDRARKLTFVDVAGVGLLPGLAAFLLVTRGRGGGLLASFLLLGRGLASWGFAASGGLLLSSFGRHFRIVTRNARVRDEVWS